MIPAHFERAQVYQWPSDLTALLAVPLHVNGGVIGVLEAVNKAGGFAKEDVPVMSVFANQAAMAIEHARLQQQAEELAVLGERQRLARELHDSVTQSLYSVTLYTNAAILALEAGKGWRRRRLSPGSCADRAGGITRHAAAYLPAAPADPGVGRAGGRTTGAPGRRRGPRRARDRVPRRGGPAPADRDRSELYWIAQEALNNVRKHAAARHVIVHLHFTAATRLPRGAGRRRRIRSASRALPKAGRPADHDRTHASVGGVLTYESTPGEGTRVMVEVTL